MKKKLAIPVAVALVAGFSGCTSHKLDHTVKLDDKPIHIKLDINVTLKKEVEDDLTDLFGDEENTKEN
ncbi:MAG: hypothetical protein CMO64_01750 [Verrucomicrobiales bacterium]|nr:hypothetical protein [Verrucomicrobiales bacterium]|tara:strand:+ start:481 stop:684 length:204 start_codon:yes stop_codon:yes gene_type:complete